MVRVFIKGGVWKNSEDEILKAAVMKYGKQQWARVASLLNRKSAKQCKARWNEWLDPSIRKVEWSREEDEKLLHLAKLMPAQWKTIGPLVGGRTAVQCQERYEQLLDEAAVGTDGDQKTSGVDGEVDGGTGSSKKLRAGDIDPHPETKPARPDPIDMDEDEIEMLQEARARLANTQGKKAKRKAREKMLNEAKRLADLQKRRELKQAGLLSSGARTKAMSGKRRRREIDLGVEIPFHKPAPAGFHSTEDEDQRADEQRRKRMKQINFKQINEAQYRSRDREEKAAKKREEARLKALERSNLQYVVAQVSKKNDPTSARKRGTLSMPAPSVSDGELEKVAKLTKEQKAESIAAMTSNGNKSATDALLGDYTDRPLPTPMRTPMTGSGNYSREVVLREASNLRMLETGQTPLLGEANPMLIEGGAGTGVELRNNTAISTAGSATPMTNSNKSANREAANKTPMTHGPRDELGLNRPNSEIRPGMGGGEVGDDVSISGTSFATSIGGQSMSIRELARAERKAMKRARKELETALANLPAPQFEYELAAPEAITDDDEKDTKMVEKDAAEIEAEENARLEKEAAKLYEERSSVMKRLDLPRPIGAVIGKMILSQYDSNQKSEQIAQKLIEEEMLQLLQHDAYKFPYLLPTQTSSDKKKKKDKKKKQSAFLPTPPEKPLDFIQEEDFEVAKQLLNAEEEKIIQEKRQLAVDIVGSFESDEEIKNYLGIATVNCSLNNEESLDAGYKSIEMMETEYNILADTVKKIRKQNDKIEGKIFIRNGGFANRCKTLKEGIHENLTAIQNSKIEESVYNSLAVFEKKGMENRIQKLGEDIEELEKTEAKLQKKYGDLQHKKHRLKVLGRQKEIFTS